MASTVCDQRAFNMSHLNRFPKRIAPLYHGNKRDILRICGSLVNRKSTKTLEDCDLYPKQPLQLHVFALFALKSRLRKLLFNTDPLFTFLHSISMVLEIKLQTQPVKVCMCYRLHHISQKFPYALLTFWPKHIVLSTALVPISQYCTGTTLQN